MADQKISQLTGATTPLAGTEVLPVVQSGSTKKVAVSNLTAGRDVATKNILSTDGGNVGGAGGFIGVAANANNTAMAGIKGSLANSAGSEDQGDLLLQTRPVGAAGQTLRTVFIGGVDGNTAVPLGNLIFQTAAKGVNFTANTPASGMTSQLLNWYEEGTWTPVVSGTWITTPTIFGTARYTRVGRQVTLTFAFLNGALALNTNGYFTGLPFNPADVGTGAVVDNNIVNRGLCEATGAGRIWVTNTLFPDVNYISITYFV